MNHLREQNNTFTLEDGVGAYTNYQKYGIEGYEQFVGKSKDSPYFNNALKQSQQLTQRRQKLYIDAMMTSPLFLETYFGAENMSYIQEHINQYKCPYQDFNKQLYAIKLDEEFSAILSSEDATKRIAEYIKNNVVASVQASLWYKNASKKLKNNNDALQSMVGKYGIPRVKKEQQQNNDLFNDQVKIKIEEFYIKKEKEIDKWKKTYCKEHFLVQAESRVMNTMYTSQEMKERSIIQKWLEQTILSIKLPDKTHEITDTQVKYNDESAISAISATKSLLKDKFNLQEHLFNLLVEMLEMQYYQAILLEDDETKHLVVKKPSLVDDIQSGADFIVIDSNNPQDPYTSYDLKTTMNKKTVTDEIIANGYDRRDVKNILFNADNKAIFKENNPDHEILNDALKFRKKRPLWGLYALDGQKGPVEKYLVKKDILGFPSNLAYVLVARVMKMISIGKNIRPQDILSLVNEHEESFQLLTKYMQEDIVDRNRLVSMRNSCSNIAKESLIQALQMKRTG